MYPRIGMNLAWTTMLSIALTSCSAQPHPHTTPQASPWTSQGNSKQAQASNDTPSTRNTGSTSSPHTRIESLTPSIPDKVPAAPVKPTPEVHTETVPAPAQQQVVPKKAAKTQAPPKTVSAKTGKQKQTNHTTAAAQNQRLTLSQLVKKYPQLLRLRGSSTGKKVALTFDDAPDLKFTPQVLDILKKYHVQATFFIVGSQAEKHPEVVKRIVNEGHVIGNHSYSHPLFTKLDEQSFQHQILQTQDTLHSLIGYRPRLIRPPYGEISENQLLWTSDRGYLVVNWNVDSMDWKQLNEPQVTSNILHHTKAGSIVLQHSGGGSTQDLSGTVRALPHVIEKLQGQGYRLVTLPELLNVPKEK
ncbi:polysaccharide deacetylase family protein [Paenibacillus validus]|nr:polysaccharide deacetylase family protein [Paenibacillus validus]MED4602599.1 polysaccharide deacetylase family protein [Paenibacillus validus]MED4607881.1 polysaccharide deacetylase family protein [Paenibacillus validus]